jgi:hypothetical protein
MEGDMEDCAWCGKPAKGTDEDGDPACAKCKSEAAACVARAGLRRRDAWAKKQCLGPARPLLSAPVTLAEAMALLATRGSA